MHHDVREGRPCGVESENPQVREGLKRGGWNEDVRVPDLQHQRQTGMPHTPEANRPFQHVHVTT